MLSGNMFEDEGRLVMDWKGRGMDKNEFDMRCWITRSW